MQSVSQSGEGNDARVRWTGRVAVLCAIVLIILTSLLDAFMRANRRHSPSFADFANTLTGRLAYIAVLDGLLLVTVLLFSRPLSAPDFLTRIGLCRRPTLAGWYAGWIALGLAVLDHYGAARGWTASARTPPQRGGYPTEHMVFLVTTSVVIGPLVEEIVTRGFLYRALRASFPLVASIGLVVCFSAFFHAGSMGRSVFTAACLVSLWVTLCIVREHTGSLWKGGMILFLLLCCRQVLQLLGAAIAENRDYES
jgi:membrane protease YdiL (CAAX protease family)